MTGAGRQAVLILGMHRSGTSAMAGLCHLLGAAAPAGMMQEAFDNPTGFWESFPISALNEAIFKSLGSSWYDSLGFNAANVGPAALGELARHCSAALVTEFGDAPCFVMKDPRFSILLELWLPTFAAMNIALAPVLALRHPTEVTSSLRRRDGMPLDIAAPMWLHYALEAERETRGRPRALLSYDRLLQDWRGAMARVAAETGIAWPQPFAAAAAAVENFLRPAMRHHHAAPTRIALGRPPLTGWIAEAYAALRALEDGGDAAHYRRLDQVREQFAVWRATAPHVTIEMAAGREPLPPRRS